MLKKYLLKLKIVLPISTITASSIVLVACSVPNVSKPTSNVTNLSDIWNNYFQPALKNFVTNNPQEASVIFGTDNPSYDYFSSLQEFRVKNPHPDKDKTADDNFIITNDNFVDCFKKNDNPNGHFVIKKYNSNETVTIFFITDAQKLAKGFELNILSLSKA